MPAWKTSVDGNRQANVYLCEDNAFLGLHPGSGSQRPTVCGCTARRNGTDGLFLCWRFRHGAFEDNLLEANGHYGISIGHKDSDNILRRNRVRLNGQSGVCFRNESRGMAAHGSDGVMEADTLRRRFLDLALDSPWAEQAQIRLDRVR